MTPNPRFFFSPLACAALASVLIASPAAAQEAKVELGKVTIQAQRTPDYQVSSVTEKRTKPREWLEFETEFEAQMADRNAEFVPSLTFKYYLILPARSKDEQATLTAEITYQSIPVGEAAHTVVYLSPSAIQKITGKKGFSDPSFWGVEVLYGGEVVGVESSTGKPWWTSEQAPPSVSGLLMKKRETPFAPLWGDYHVDEADAQ